MPVAELDGIPTRYSIVGDGPELLMFSPGGFDASLDSWQSMASYRRLNLVEQLASRYRLILFDRRESGQSGGRLERLTWSKYAAQAVALLDKLGIERAHAMGGCVGCSSAAVLAVAHPGRLRSLVLFSPAGGVHYRLAQHRRFTQHLAFAQSHGLAAVADLARSTAETFSSDPRVGPWGAALRNSHRFSVEYSATDPAHYEALTSGTARGLFDRDTVPGPEPEDLLTLPVPALIVPGQDRSHAPSAARYLQECLPEQEYWDIPVAARTDKNVPPRILEFLRRH